MRLHTEKDSGMKEYNEHRERCSDFNKYTKG